MKTHEINAKRVNDFLKVIILLNKLNIKLNGKILPGNPWTVNFWRGMASLEESPKDSIFYLVPDEDFIKSLIIYNEK